MVVYGGGDGSGIFNDIYKYHIGISPPPPSKTAERRWEKPATNGEGPQHGRSHASLVYRKETNEVILFAGLMFHRADGTRPPS